MFNRHLMGRRQFLKASSTCVVAAAAVGPKLFAADGAVQQQKRLSVGFATSEDGAMLVSASSIPFGDGYFIGRGARVTVSGASGASDPNARRAVELLVHHSYFDGAERRTAPFRSWASDRASGGQGNSISFTVPVDDVQALSMTLASEFGQIAGSGASRRRALRAGGTGSVEFPISLGLQHDAPMKLARGYYVIVPVFEGESEPSWPSYSLHRLNGRWALVDGMGVVAPFEHVVLRVDYAS